jgi:hypothetical protein
MEFLHIPKKLNGLSDRVLSLVSNGEEFPHKCEQENQAMKEAWEGRDPTEHICDLAQGNFVRVVIFE